MPSCAVRLIKSIHNRSDAYIPFNAPNPPTATESIMSYLRSYLGGGYGNHTNQYFAVDTFLNCQFVKDTLSGTVDVDTHTSADTVTNHLHQYNYLIIYYDRGSPIFAFVDHLEYVNPNSVRVYYSVDTIMTYRNNIGIGGLVDRLSLPYDYNVASEPTDSANLDFYTQPEPFGVDEYVVAEIKRSADDAIYHRNMPLTNNDSLYSYEIIIEYNGASLPYIASSTFTTVTYYACDNYFSAYNFLTTGLEFSNINKIYMCPSCCVTHGATVESGVYLVTDLRYNRTWEYWNVHTLLTLSNLDGYIPKNKKLLLYPYTFSLISTPDNSIQIKNEFWSGHLQVTCSGVFPPEMSLRPRGYRRTATSNSTLEVFYADNRERLLLNNYPMGNVQTTAFDQWLSQSAVPRMSSFAVKAGTDIATENVGGLASEVTSLGLEMLSTKYQPNLSTGGFISTSDDTESGYKKFQYSLLTLPNSKMRQFDRFLTNYGYSLNGYDIRNINLKAREHFTYVKMRRCEIQFVRERGNSGGQFDYTPLSITNSECDDITRRFERGVRLWRNLDLRSDAVYGFLQGSHISNDIL